jgi:hypothetical protein
MSYSTLCSTRLTFLSRRDEFPQQEEEEKIEITSYIEHTGLHVQS